MTRIIGSDVELLIIAIDVSVNYHVGLPQLWIIKVLGVQLELCRVEVDSHSVRHRCQTQLLWDPKLL